MGTTEPGGRPDPVVAPLEAALDAEPQSDLAPEPEDVLEPVRTRRWPVEERMGRVRLLAQSLFVSAGLASALIVTHIATASPAHSVAPTTPGAPPATSSTTTPTSRPAGATPGAPPATSPPPAPVTTTTPPPATTTTPAPVTVTTICTTTPSGTTLCN